jgi:hypothetical protein
MPQFTYLQQKLLDVLNDGFAHTKDELKKVIDPLASDQNLRDHICAIRKLLRVVGHDIVCVYANRRTMYRRVMLIYKVGGQPYVDVDKETT